MTLSGNLGFVPLDEVLRLLTRSGNSGVVEISNGNTSGRIFVAQEGIGLATTFEDQTLRNRLVSSGYLRADSPDDNISFNDDLLALIREMTVESIYQMNTEESDFQVVRDASSPFSAKEPFDLETVLEDSVRRAGEWDKVSKLVPDLTAEMKINRELQSETVELDREAWRIVSEIGSGASVHELATRLGTTDFAVASVAASMIGTDLLIVEGGYAPPEAEVAYGETEYVSEESPADEVSYDDADHGETELEAEPPADGEVDPDRSWWDEPEDEASAASESEQVDEPVAADDSTQSDDASNEEDTDAFLEKVFSEVGNETPEEDGHGLMRRRRMGSILRELGED